MGIIRIYGKAGKTKRKPGWQKEQAEYEAWLAKVKSQTTSFSSTPKPLKKRIDPVVPNVPRVTEPEAKPVSRYVKGSSTKEVARPDILYRDDPEMLQRELAARSRKFAIAPMYNKGAATLMTDDTMEDLKKGLLRRR